ncbi:MAG: flavin reductase family protein [Acidimicrobiales bacterium]
MSADAPGDDGPGDGEDRAGWGSSSLRYGNPWAGPPEARDPLRRLRGHLVLPVTVWTGTAGAGPVGLTISSVLLGQGQPPVLAGLVSPTSDLAALLRPPSARFVVHVLGAAHRRLAQHFSGDLPAPEEMLAVLGSPHGPLLQAVGDRLLCRTTSTKPLGWSVLVEAEVDEVQAGAAGRGLAWYHGAYHTLGT